jgi:hypothetical protein
LVRDPTAAQTYGNIDALTIANVMTFADKGCQAPWQCAYAFKRHRLRPVGTTSNADCLFVILATHSNRQIREHWSAMDTIMVTAHGASSSGEASLLRAAQTSLEPLPAL